MELFRYLHQLPGPNDTTVQYVAPLVETIDTNSYRPKPEPLIQAKEKPVITINYYYSGILLVGSIVLGQFLLLSFRKKPAEIKRSRKTPLFLFIPGKDQLIRNTGRMYTWANNLNQRKEGLRQMLDIKRTIAVSIKNGGYATIVLKPILQRPQYLFIIDFDYYDQHAYVFRHLSNFFTGEAVSLEVFYFRSDPRVCWNTNYPAGIGLADLHIAFPSHSLLLFTDGGSLVNFRSGKVFPWVSAAFSGWAQNVLLTPKATEKWGFMESALSPIFKVLPDSPDGIGQMSKYLNLRVSERMVTDLQELKNRPERGKYNRLANLTADVITLADIKDFFNNASLDKDCELLLLQWAYATALYPVPSWDMTLLAGHAIQQFSGYTEPG